MSGSTEDINKFSIDIDKWEYNEIARFIHLSDIEAYTSISSQIDKIAAVAEITVKAIKKGGRAIYVGAGTSGRIAVIDVVELMPTYGLGKESFDYVMAGGDRALTESVEGSEDDKNEAVLALKEKKLSASDILIGVSASGSTPYVLAAMEYARSIGCTTIGITSNSKKPINDESDICIELLTGAEVIQGSTRMKAGTAQKMTLNIISTSVAIKLGRTYKNTMSNMGSWYNEKLKQRAINILVEQFKLSQNSARKILEKVDYNISSAISIAKARGGNQSKKRKHNPE